MSLNIDSERVTVDEQANDPKMCARLPVFFWHPWIIHWLNDSYHAEYVTVIGPVPKNAFKFDEPEY